MASKRLRKKMAKQQQAITPKKQSIKSKYRSMKQNVSRETLSIPAPQLKSYEREIPEEWENKLEKDKTFLRNMLTNRMDEIPPEYLEALDNALETATEGQLESIIDFYGDDNGQAWKEFYEANSEYEAGQNTEDEKFGTLLSVLEALGVDIDAI